MRWIMAIGIMYAGGASAMELWQTRPLLAIWCVSAAVVVAIVAIDQRYG